MRLLIVISNYRFYQLSISCLALMKTFLCDVIGPMSLDWDDGKLCIPVGSVRETINRRLRFNFRAGTEGLEVQEKPDGPVASDRPQLAFRC